MTGRNACGLSGGELSGRWNCYYAALPIGCGAQSVDSRARCGDCIKVCGSKGCTVVKVIDQCASCSCGDVDLSTDALQATTGYDWDRKPVTWEWLDSCDSGDSASLSIASLSEDTSASARSSSASSEEEAAAAEEAAREERRRKRKQRRRKERRDRLRKERQQRRVSHVCHLVCGVLRLMCRLALWRLHLTCLGGYSHTGFCLHITDQFVPSIRCCRTAAT